MKKEKKLRFKHLQKLLAFIEDSRRKIFTSGYEDDVVEDFLVQMNFKISELDSNIIQRPDEFIRILEIVLNSPDSKLRSRLDKVIEVLKDVPDDKDISENLIVHIETVLP